ncbi:hypothetical protein VCUG_01670, partial [Vavraia culicis subsp. floridensis]
MLLYLFTSLVLSVPCDSMGRDGSFGGRKSSRACPLTVLLSECGLSVDKECFSTDSYGCGSSPCSRRPKRHPCYTLFDVFEVKPEIVCFDFMCGKLKTCTFAASYLLDVQEALRCNVIDGNALNFIMRRFLWYVRDHPKLPRQALEVPWHCTKWVLDPCKVFHCLESVVLRNLILRKLFIKFLTTLSNELIAILRHEMKMCKPRRKAGTIICLPLEVVYLQTIFEVVKHLLACATMVQKGYVEDMKKFEVADILVLNGTDPANPGKNKNYVVRLRRPLDENGNGNGDGNGGNGNGNGNGGNGNGNGNGGNGNGNGNG